jgi:hypothetical protein
VIVFVSGKLVGYLVDNYLFEGASKSLPSNSKLATKLEMLKGESIAKHLGFSDTFLTEDEVADEYNNIPALNADDLKIKSFFAKKRNYFI